jgi:lipopolysaccharide biosynthesis regulator YciM
VAPPQTGPTTADSRWLAAVCASRLLFNQIFVAYAAIIGNLTSSNALTGAVERFVFEHPVLANLVNAAELRALPAAERAAAIQRIAGSLRTIAMANARYRCANCGYSTQRFIWHCPSCKLWETVRPIQSVPLENVLARA